MTWDSTSQFSLWKYDLFERKIIVLISVASSITAVLHYVACLFMKAPQNFRRKYIEQTQLNYTSIQVTLYDTTDIM